MKECKSCRKEKPLIDFYKGANNKDGYKTECKLCHNSSVDKDKKKEYDKKRYQENREETIDQSKKYRHFNKPEIKKRREYNKKYAEDHKEEKKTLNKKYYENNKLKIKVRNIEP